MAAYSNAHFGAGEGDILLDHVRCNTSRSTTLFNCTHRGWRVHDCTHKEDVGVTCCK